MNKIFDSKEILYLNGKINFLHVNLFLWGNRNFYPSSSIISRGGTWNSTERFVIILKKSKIVREVCKIKYNLKHIEDRENCHDKNNLNFAIM